MDQKIRKTESESLNNQDIEDFIKKKIFKILNKGKKASEKEAEVLIDDFIRSLE